MNTEARPVGAESRMGADAAIIEYLDLLALVAVAFVGNPLWILAPEKSVAA